MQDGEETQETQPTSSEGLAPSHGKRPAQFDDAMRSPCKVPRASKLEVEVPIERNISEATERNDALGDDAPPVQLAGMEPQAVAGAPPVVAGAPPQPNQVGGALVVFQGGAPPLVPDANVSQEEVPVQLMVSLEDVERIVERRVSEVREEMQQQLTPIRERIDYALVLEELNSAVVAIGLGGKHLGSGFFLKLNDDHGLIVTCHHVLLDALWDSKYNDTSPFTVDLGKGEVTTWAHKAVVIAHFTSPQNPRPHMPDHRDNMPKPHFDMALLKLVGGNSPLTDIPLTDLPHLEWSTDVREGDEVDLLGYGQQLKSNVRNSVFGRVACTKRIDRELGCRVIDIQGDMLSGHSGGPVVNRRTRKVIGICISSQHEIRDFKVRKEKHNGKQDYAFTANHEPLIARVANSCGGLHVVVPIEHVEKLYQTAIVPKLQ